MLMIKILKMELTSFDDNGFSVGNYSDSNGSEINYVAWTWKAGGNKNTFNVDDVGYATAAAAGLTGGIYSLLVHLLEPNKDLVLLNILDSGSSGTAGTINHGLSEKTTFIYF